MIKLCSPFVCHIRVLAVVKAFFATVDPIEVEECQSIKVRRLVKSLGNKLHSQLVFQSLFLQPQKHTDWQTAAPCFHFEAREEECQYDGTWFCKDSAGQICAWTSRLSFERKTCFCHSAFIWWFLKRTKHDSDYRFLLNRQLSCLQLKQGQNCVSVKASVKDDLFACLFPWARCFFSISVWALTLI